MPGNDFDFFLLVIRRDIRLFRCFAGVSNTGKACIVGAIDTGEYSLPVSTTLVSDTFTVLESFTGVNDTSTKLLTGVIDTAKHVFASVNDIGEACLSLIPGSKDRQLRRCQ
jgi:hypothetical protein